MWEYSKPHGNISGRKSNISARIPKNAFFLNGEIRNLGKPSPEKSIFWVLCRNITFSCRNITMWPAFTPTFLCRAIFRGCAKIFISGRHIHLCKNLLLNEHTKLQTKLSIPIPLAALPPNLFRFFLPTCFCQGPP